MTVIASNRNPTNPRSIKPLGNLVLAHDSSNLGRFTSLGKLSTLPDELLLNIFSELSPSDLHRSQGVSKHFFAWCAALDGLWKPGLITKNDHRLSDWKGSWRSTYIHKFIFSNANLKSSDRPNPESLPTDSIQTENVYSDVLFQPILCVNHSIQSIINRLTTRSKKVHTNIERINFRGPSYHSKQLDKPKIFKGLIDEWPAYQRSSDYVWTLDSLQARYPNIEFTAESTHTTLADYRQYHDDCWLDESPVYLFDSQFVEKSCNTSPENRGLGDDFSVPEIFQQDLFSCLGAQRPDYRWLIIGPARSGSTWHVDPNGTSAWNAVIRGRKYWICFPPHINPPGVIVNEDESEVESPLSISEWFLNYYQVAKEIYGPFSKDSQTRGLMMEGICEAGDTFFVPSGWWHLVINLEPSIAITQNFVSERELSSVLHFMKYKPDQLSGFKLSDNPERLHKTSPSAIKSNRKSIFESFVDALRQSTKISNATIAEKLVLVEELEHQRSQKRFPRLNHRQEPFGHHKIKKRPNMSNQSHLDSSIWNKIRKQSKVENTDPSSVSHQTLLQLEDHTHGKIDKSLETPKDNNVKGCFQFGFHLE